MQKEQLSQALCILKRCSLPSRSLLLPVPSVPERGTTDPSRRCRRVVSASHRSESSSSPPCPRSPPRSFSSSPSSPVRRGSSARPRTRTRGEAAVLAFTQSCADACSLCSRNDDGSGSIVFPGLSPEPSKVPLPLSLLLSLPLLFCLLLLASRAPLSLPRLASTPLLGDHL